MAPEIRALSERVPHIQSDRVHTQLSLSHPKQTTLC